MTYSEKLRDPRWQRKSAQVKDAHNWRCEDCKAGDKTLEVHHCYYIKGLEPWNYGDELLMCLCSECHEFRQGREIALHVALAKVLRGIDINVLEETAWDLIHDAIKKHSNGEILIVRNESTP